MEKKLIAVQRGEHGEPVAELISLDGTDNGPGIIKRDGKSYPLANVQMALKFGYWTPPDEALTPVEREKMRANPYG